MRIGINCFMLQPHIGGLKQYFLTLLDELLASDRGNRYVLFYFDHNLEQLAQLRNDGWRENAILIRDQDEVLRHLGRIDLYFCPFGALWPRPVPIPSVVTLVDIQEVFYPEFFTPMDMFNREYHFRGSVRTADAVITISEFSKRTIVKHYRAPEWRVSVSHLCADPRFYKAAETGVPPATALPAAGYAIYPANRWPHKNHAVLLEAMRLLNGRGLRIDTVFTGYDMPGGYPLLEKADACGIGNQVHALGYVTVEEMAYLYSRARMLLFPSLFEGFGIPLVEAMAAGCPVACSNATSLPEIGLDAAEYFDPHSAPEVAAAIERLWAGGKRREECIAAGRRRAGDFSPARMAAVHISTFEEAARRFRNRRYWWQQFCGRHIHRTFVFFKYRKVLMSQNDTPGSGGISVNFSGGWHRKEEHGADWLRWTGGTGVVTVTTARDGTLEITGDVASSRTPDQVDVRLNGRVVATWVLENGAFEFQAIEPLLLRGAAGRNTIEFMARNEGFQPPGDPRTLAFAVRNLNIKLRESAEQRG